MCKATAASVAISRPLRVAAIPSGAAEMEDRAMSVFEHPELAGHEQIVFCHDPGSGLRTIIAIHDTTLGPALGGVRMWPYRDERQALEDVLRLSRGMTYKAALAGLALGGGKAVILGDPRRDKTPAMMRAMGRCIDRLGGRYLGAEDSGTGVADLKLMALETAHVVGIQDKQAANGRRSGDPSPATAYGVRVGIQVAAARRLGRTGLAGLRVAIQGVGNVGLSLGRYLNEAGAALWVCDLHEEQLRRAVQELGAQAVAPEQVYDLAVDVLAPCALGAVINDDTLARLRARIVAGSANNQLAQPRHGRALAERGILYAPDYVINAGGLIDVANELTGHERARVLRQVEGIGDTLQQIFARAEAEGLATSDVADRLAEERLQAARARRHEAAAATAGGLGALG
jgi:leucine dehydrogenase